MQDSSASFPTAIYAAEIVSSLSCALDLTEGRPMGHAMRACMLGMRIASEIGMPVEDQTDLYYALLLKDAGCSSNASRMFHLLHADEIRAKRDVKTTDWTRVGWESLQYALTHIAVGAPFLERVRTLINIAANQQNHTCEFVKVRCERGAAIARRMGFSEAVAQGIGSLDEHWNGAGHPDGLRGKTIPLFSRIANLAQVLAVFLEHHGRQTALEVAKKRSGRWFDPDLVKATLSLGRTGKLWNDLDSDRLLTCVVALEPEHRRMLVEQDTLENICLAFADVIDAKSPFTYRHSTGVANAAISIAERLGYAAEDVTLIRRAALLHDIGKLSVPNTILEKPAKLSADEWDVVKLHPYYTLEVLRKVPGCEQLSDIAAAHHEKLDGSGYFRNWGAEQLSMPARILAVADIYDALSAKRPYRDSLPLETVLSIMRKDVPHALDPDCFQALVECTTKTDSLADLEHLSHAIGSSQPVEVAEPASARLSTT